MAISKEQRIKVAKPLVEVSCFPKLRFLSCVLSSGGVVLVVVRNTGRRDLLVESESFRRENCPTT